MLPDDHPLRGRIADRQRQGLIRVRSHRSTPGTVTFRERGREIVSFASNDYLGLALDHDLKSALATAVDHWGVGAGAAQLLGGYTSAHAGLEQQVAQWLGYEAAVSFASGYQANVSVISALADADCSVIMDRLCHASLIDGALLSGATMRRFLHNDGGSLRLRLAGKAHPLVIAEGLYSMDGDRGRVREIAAVSREAGALVMVDEAHSMGVLGPGGRGVCAEQDVRPDLLTMTLGKAFGMSGALILGSAELIDAIVQFGRGYIYSTAMPPALAATAMVAVEKVRTGDSLREKLRHNLAILHSAMRGLDLVGDPESPICHLMMRSVSRAVKIADLLAQRGFEVPAIRPPTVPPDTARLRISLSAAHTRTHIEGLAAALHELL